MNSCESNTCVGTYCNNDMACNCREGTPNTKQPFLFATDPDPKALVIGINYIGQNGELNGCINDAENIKATLIKKCNYRDENITILTDNTNNKPTKVNMVSAIITFVQDIKKSNTKTAWFSFSGHGYYIQDDSSDEMDGHDEVIVPLDYAESGVITDDEIYDLLIKEIPLDCKLFCIVDSCHSGTAMDLPLKYDSEMDVCHNQKMIDRQLPNVIKLSGCRDTQTSADAYIGDQYQGALTSTFLSSIGSCSSIQLLQHVHEKLKETFTQLPVLTCTNQECIRSLLLPPQATDANNIRINLTVDYWHYESTWNIVNMSNSAVVFHDNQHFTKSFGNTLLDLHLEPGSYMLYIIDEYGDGGVHGNIAHVDKGKLLNVDFSSDKYFTGVFEV